MFKKFTETGLPTEFPKPIELEDDQLEMVWGGASAASEGGTTRDVASRSSGSNGIGINGLNFNGLDLN